MIHVQSIASITDTCSQMWCFCMAAVYSSVQGAGHAIAAHSPCAGLRLGNSGAGAQQASPLWDGPVQMLQAEPVAVSKYQQLLAAEADDEQEPSSTQTTQAQQRPAQAGGEEHIGPEGAEADAGPADEVEDETDPFEQAAGELDSSSGPAHFTDFLKTVLRPRSVVKVHVPATLAGCGFGDLHASGSAAAQVRCPRPVLLKRPWTWGLCSWCVLVQEASTAGGLCALSMNSVMVAACWP